MDTQIIDETIGIAKTVLPWITGGLGGAIVGFLLNRRINKKREARLNISTKTTEFSITGESPLREKLSVSYDGRHCKKLFVAECTVENLSGRTVLDGRVIFEFDNTATHVTEPIIDSSPVPSISCSFSKVDKSAMLQCLIERIEPNTQIRLQFLVDGPPKFRVAHVAAKDDPEIVQAGTDGSNPEPDVLVRIWAMYAAIYTLAGALPVLNTTIRGALIIATIPAIRRTAAYYRARRLHDNPRVAIGSLYVNDSGTANVTVGRVDR